MRMWECSRLGGRISSRGGQIERHRAAWIKERNQEAKERREKVGDWVGNAVEELKSERAAIEGFGLEGYFEKSLARLEELRSGKGESVPKLVIG